MPATDFLPQEGHYRKLSAFQLAECIYALTYDFAHRHLKAGDRTIDQMVQAARSGKQNIAEGSVDGITSREMMIENIIRLDSLERELGYMQVYAENVAQIMEGRSPVVRTFSPTSEEKITSDKEVIAPSTLDSLLRGQLEGEGRYGLNTRPEKQKITNAEILRPVEAVVVESFSPASGRYGVRLAVESIQQVCAVQEGTVVLTTLEPEGYMVQIQHSSNFISTYRGLGQAHKQQGERVEAGEAIGSTWTEESDSQSAAEMEIQFWFDGAAVNPENYIRF